MDSQIQHQVMQHDDLIRFGWFGRGFGNRFRLRCSHRFTVCFRIWLARPRINRFRLRLCLRFGRIPVRMLSFTDQEYDNNQRNYCYCYYNYNRNHSFISHNNASADSSITHAVSDIPDIFLSRAPQPIRGLRISIFIH